MKVRVLSHEVLFSNVLGRHYRTGNTSVCLQKVLFPFSHSVLPDRILTLELTSCDTFIPVLANVWLLAKQ